MFKTASSPPTRRIGPHSRTFGRGSAGDTINGRSREGKFLRRIESELTAQVGGQPSFAQQLLIRRIAKATLRLELFDEKLAGGSWTDNDARTFGGLSNALRLMLRELGLKAPPARRQSLSEYLAVKHGAST